MVGDSGFDCRCVDAEYVQLDKTLEPGPYVIEVCEFRPKVRYHIQVKVLCKGDDLDEGYERYSAHGPYEKVLTYLSKQEMARAWRIKSEPDISKMDETRDRQLKMIAQELMKRLKMREAVSNENVAHESGSGTCTVTRDLNCSNCGKRIGAVRNCEMYETCDGRQAWKSLDHEVYDVPNYCPNCGKKVVNKP